MFTHIYHENPKNRKPMSCQVADANLCEGFILSGSKVSLLLVGEKGKVAKESDEVGVVDFSSM